MLGEHSKKTTESFLPGCPPFAFGDNCRMMSYPMQSPHFSIYDLIEASVNSRHCWRLLIGILLHSLAGGGWGHPMGCVLSRCWRRHSKQLVVNNNHTAVTIVPHMNKVCHYYNMKGDIILPSQYITILVISTTVASQ